MRCLVTILIFAALVPSCVEAERSYDLLDGDEIQQERSAEYQRLQAMQQVIFETAFALHSNFGASFTPATCAKGALEGTWGEVSEVALDEHGVCRFKVTSRVEPDRFESDLQDTCTVASELTCLPNLEDHLCEIAHYKDVAEVRAAGFVEDDVSFGYGELKLSYPPQSTAARAALYKFARQKVVALTDSVARKVIEGIETAGACRNELETLTQTYVELYHLYDELTDLAVEAEVAVADAQRSVAATLREGIQKSIEGEDLSRLSAARLLVAGAGPLIPGRQSVAASSQYDPDGFCSVPELGPKARKAVGIVRQTGISPKVLELGNDGDGGADPPIEAILAGPLDVGGVAEASIRERLGRQPGFPAFNDAICQSDPEVTCLSTAGEVAGAFGLDPSDFAEARQFIWQQNRAFARSDRGILNATVDCSEDTTVCAGTCSQTFDCTPRYDLRNFAATSTPPNAGPEAYWAAIAGHWPDNGNAWGYYYDFTGERQQAFPNDPVPPAPTDLSSYAYSSAKGASDLLNKIQGAYWPGTGEPSRVSVGAPLNLLRETLEDVSSIRYCDGNSVTLYGSEWVSDASGLTLVHGEDGLRCATEGDIDGTLCSEQFAAELTIGVLTPAQSQWFASLNNFLTPTPRERLYLVRPRDPDVLAPGGYVAIAGWNWDSYQGDANWQGKQCVSIPVLPYAQERAAEVLRPSPSWCSHPAVECNGTEFDARLPLENELSTDGDDVESSWRSYLALARQAADEADLLGREYFQAAIDAKQREETVQLRDAEKRRLVANELEQLQDICGTSIDISGLLEKIGANDLDWNTTSWFGNKLSALLWAQSDELLPDLTRLKACLGSEAPVIGIDDGGDADFTGLVTLGDQWLCVPRGESGKLCDGISDCPRGLGGPPCADEDIAEPLGYFEYTPLRDDFTGTELCRMLRKERNFDGRVYNRETFQLLESNVIPLLASRVRWEPKVGGYSSVMLDGVDYFTTGDWETGPSDAWPCAPYTYSFVDNEDQQPCVLGTYGADSLFCGVNPGCAQTAGRTQLNHRLMRAVKVLGGRSQITVPVRVHERAWDAGGTEIADDYVEDPRSSGSYVRYSKYRHESEDFNNFELTVFSGGASIWYDENNVAKSPPNDVAFGRFWQNGTWVPEAPLAQLSAYLEDTDYEAPFMVGGWNVVGDSDAGELDGWTVEGFSTSLVNGRQPVLDAAELACELLQLESAVPSCSVKTPPEIRSAADVAKGTKYLECLAKRVERAGADAVFQNMPAIAKDSMRESGGIEGSFPTLTGELGVAVADLRERLVGVASLSNAVSTELTLMAADMDAFFLALSRARSAKETAQRVEQLQREIADVSARATCAAAISSAPSLDIAGAVSKAAGAPVQCAWAFQQSDLQGELAFAQTEAQGETADFSVDDALIAFRSATAGRASTLGDLRIALATEIEGIDKQLAVVDSLRRRARRLFYRAVYTASDQAEAQAEVSMVMATRRDGRKTRYERALKNAKLMAFVAKRAVEQRIGMHLSDLRVDLPLVNAPSTWESTVCTMDGIDYTAITDTSASDEERISAYADGFIGDYVSKLEDFVESYRMTYAFQEGDDTAVVSLRDDIHRVNGDCVVESGNLLHYSGNLTLRPHDPNGWHATNCLTDAGSGDVILPCVDAEPSNWPDPPFLSPQTHLGWARAYDIRFGTGGVDQCADEPTEFPTGCGFRSRQAAGDDSSHIAQKVHLSAGRYLLSWHRPGLPQVGAELVEVEVDGALYTPSAIYSKTTESAWERLYFPFEVDVEQDISVRVVQRGQSESATIAALMLEDISGVSNHLVVAGDIAPSPYIGTAEDTTRILPECEDTYGDRFRADHWTRDCVWLCSDGYGTSCGNKGGERACYWETSFDLSQWAIERGGILQSSGFARGNYNYRIDTIGLNFVGTGIRDCEGSTTPSACYGGGFVPYSLVHLGPYYVRNHLGAEFKAQLFTGAIEHARGLATERYISNPTSSADAELLGQFLRHELRGRPIDGQYLLRVWDEPGIKFDGIQDVQIVMGYRYWTRNE